MTEQEIAKAQFEWDTLLIVGWRRFWTMAKVRFEFNKLGYEFSVLDELKRANTPFHLWKAPVRAAFDQLLHSFSQRLWSCKETAGFVELRNQLNAEDPEFVLLKRAFDREKGVARRQYKIDKAVNEFKDAQYQAWGDTSQKSNATARAKSRRNRSLA